MPRMDQQVSRGTSVCIYTYIYICCTPYPALCLEFQRPDVASPGPGSRDVPEPLPDALPHPGLGGWVGNPEALPPAAGALLWGEWGVLGPQDRPCSVLAV